MKQINFIRRDSDGEIFTIGDKIFDSLVKGGGTIRDFDFDESVGTLIVTDEGACTIDQAVKIHSDTPSFVIQLNRMKQMIDEILESNLPMSPDVEKELSLSKTHLESVYDYVISEE